MNLKLPKIAAVAVILLCSVFVSAQETQREKNRTALPTVTGGTGLFTVYDSSTLKKGEVNFGAYANNYDRDPGDVDITQGILNVGYGLTDRLEIFAASVFRQKLHAGSPQVLSGFYLPNVRYGRPATPVRVGGTSNNPDIAYPGFFEPDVLYQPPGPCHCGRPCPPVLVQGPPITGAPVGGVLPQIPNAACGRPGFLNDNPFFGRSTAKVGVTTVGGKYRFTSQESRLGVALVGFVEIPSFGAKSVFSGNGSGIVSGSGAGNADWGFILAVTPRVGLVSFNFNFGYVKTGDPEAYGFKLIDRKNKLINSLGVDIPFNQYVQLVSELSSIVYVGSGTPNLNEKNPLDFTIGARFVPTGNKGKWILALGGAYRYNFVNNSDIYNDTDYQGYVANVTLGYRRPVPPDPCKGNVPPTVTVSGDKLSVKEKTTDVVTLTAVGKDTDARDTTLTYSWSASTGSISGTGPSVTWTPGAAAPGTATITVTATDSCNNTGSGSTTITIEKGNTCPSVSVSASPTSVREGSDTPVELTANGSDPDNDSLTYTWSASRGTIEGTGPSVRLNTTGAAPGTITISVTVNDGKCDGSSSTSVEIIPKPEPPKAYTTACDSASLPRSPFKRNVSRIDNQCKAILDEIANRLQNDRTAVAIVDGHSDKGEKAGTAKARADKAKEYLVSKGIDANRIEVRSFDDTRPAASGQNARVTIYVVPEGAQRPE